jgi:hypothetical protein
MNDDTKKIFRREVDAWCVKINGVDLLVHKSQGYTGGLELFNIAEPLTGMKIGSKRGSVDSAIRLGRDYIKNLEKKMGANFAELIADKQELWKDVMELPEEEQA